MVRRLGGQLRVREEAQRSEAIVDGDEDNALLRKRSSIRGIQGPRTAPPAPTVIPDHHRASVARPSRRPDVEEEAILALRLGDLREESAGRARQMRTRRADGIAVANACPGRDWLRRLPPELHHSLRRISKALECADALLQRPGNDVGLHAYGVPHSNPLLL